ncbi:hypothetical protein GHK86_02580 [Acidimicrobiaceae bacterium USS-CC1]|uniref:DUF4398 domain-containing protein n=1 Tax=Acidiferrimicrobium australe TaxID=2664430 RepID=A0ABW9QQ55_9ACTN|nr:hypothetical protein [Acidiferrimicrobium australe]
MVTSNPPVGSPMEKALAAARRAGVDLNDERAVQKAALAEAIRCLDHAGMKRKALERHALAMAAEARRAMYANGSTDEDARQAAVDAYRRHGGKH